MNLIRVMPAKGQDIAMTTSIFLAAPQRAAAIGRTMFANPAIMQISTAATVSIGVLACFFRYIH